MPNQNITLILIIAFMLTAGVSIYNHFTGNEIPVDLRSAFTATSQELE